MQNKILSVIGYGALGKAIAKAAHAFGVTVLIAERAGQVPREGRVSFEAAIKNADIISLHCPLNEQTKNLIAAKEFMYMKKTAVLINTSRGGIVNESDLINALNTQQIAGAAFDVLSEEPAKDANPLINYKGENLLLTPHIAWASQESVSRLFIEIRRNIEAFLKGEKRNRV